MSACQTHPNACSDQWRITGFYTPVETDFTQHLLKSLTLSNGQQHRLNAEFVKVVKIEGWGKTRFAWYLGYYNNQWHRNKKPLNAKGKPLVKGIVAVDNSRVRKGAKLVIPGLKEALGFDEFVADDVGSAIKNQHIDIYTGEGNAAKLLTYKITGQQRVC